MVDEMEHQEAFHDKVRKKLIFNNDKMRIGPNIMIEEESSEKESSRRPSAPQMSPHAA